MTNPLLTALPPVHPGAILREDILPAVGKPKAEIARLLKVSRQTLHDILSEQQPVTVRMALRLARMFGNSPEMWLRLQQNYDLRTIGKDMAEELLEIPQLEMA